MSDYKKIKTEYANKTKNRKKKKNNLLIYGIFSLCISLLLFVLAFVAIYSYNDEIAYKETERKSYTFVEFIATGIGRHREYWLYVEEVNKPLLITKVTMDADLFERLEELSKGTEISCRIINIKEFLFPSKGSYEVVEIRTDQELLTLEEYNERTKDNAITGIIVCPIVGAIFLFLSFLCFKYR